MRWLFHPVVSLVIRIALGAILIYASLHKISDPPDFAKIVYNYKLFPEGAINLVAIYVPWIELVAGAALISGIGRRGASLIALGFFASFIVVLGYNLARDCPTICGCFDTYERGKELTDAEKFSKMRREIFLVDIPCFLLAGHVLVSSFLRRGGGKAEEAEA